VGTGYNINNFISTSSLASTMASKLSSITVPIYLYTAALKSVYITLQVYFTIPVGIGAYYISA